MRAARLALASLLVLVGISAIPAGIALVADPSGRGLGMAPEMLGGGPFSDFLVPGLVLLGVHGLGGLIAAGLVFAGSRLTAWLGLLAGSALLVWMLVQLGVIGHTHWLQAVYVGVGLAELGLGLTLLRAGHLAARIARWIAGVSCALAGIAAVAGGVEFLLYPMGSPLQADLDVSVLHATPFPDFFVPGLLLAGVVGGCHVAAAIALVLRPRVGARLGVVAGGAMAVWILAEMALLGTHDGIELVFLALGWLTLAVSYLAGRSGQPASAEPAEPR